MNFEIRIPTTNDLQHFSQEIYKAVSFGLSTPFRVGLSIVVSILSFIAFVMITFPQYAFEMVSSGYFVQMMDSLIWLILESSGELGLVLLGVYSIVTGVLVTLVVGNLQFQAAGSGGVLSVLPAILFSGCASCGAGLLGVIGAFGFASIFPFEGNLVRLVGILMVIGVFGWIGDPRECAIDI